MAEIRLTDHNLLENHHEMFSLHWAEFRSYCPLFFNSFFSSTPSLFNKYSAQTSELFGLPFTTPTV